MVQEEIHLLAKLHLSSSHDIELHIYSPKVGSGPIMVLTNRRSTPTKITPVLQHFNVLPNIYYEKMELEEIHLSAT
jgi:hypothetical protein